MCGQGDALGPRRPRTRQPLRPQRGLPGAPAPETAQGRLRQGHCLQPPDRGGQGRLAFRFERAPTPRTAAAAEPRADYPDDSYYPDDPDGHYPTPTTPVETPAGPSLDGTYRSLLKAGKEGKGELWAEGEIIVKGGQITNIGLVAGGGVVAVECTGGPSKSTSDFSPIAPLISEAIGNGMFSAVYMTHAYRVEFSGTLKYNPATQKRYGEMNFSMTGKSASYTCGKEAHGGEITYTP